MQANLNHIPTLAKYMESGYKILWTEHALNELKETYTFLETHWTERELTRLSVELERVLMLISNNPRMFALSEETSVRRAPIRRLNMLYYRVIEKEKTVQVLSFFNNRQNPEKRKI